MSATAEAPAKPKKPPARLTMAFRDGKQIYSLPKRERDKIDAAIELCGELSQVNAMGLEAGEAKAKLEELLGKFEE